MVFVKMGTKGVNLGTVDDEDLCYGVMRSFQKQGEGRQRGQMTRDEKWVNNIRTRGQAHIESILYMRVI